MPEYLAPGVFVEETSFRSKSIEGVSTTTTAMIGPTRYGPIDLPNELITSVVEFERTYGNRRQLGFAAGTAINTLHNYLWQGVRAFFEEGGKRLYISRVFRNHDNTQYTGFDSAADVDPDATYNDGHARALLSGTDEAATLKIWARYPGAAGNVRVRFTLSAGQNILSFAGTAPRVGAILDRDVVMIGKPATFSFALATWSEADKTWVFTPGVGAATTKLSDVKGSDGYEIRVVTAAVIVTPGDEPGISQVWAGLALDPDHARDGSPDSLTQKFELDTAHPSRGRDLPIAMSKGTLTGALPILHAIAPSGGALETALKNPASTNDARSVEVLLRGGSDGARPTSGDYQGEEIANTTRKKGLVQLEDLEDISIVAAPGSTFGYEGSYASDAATNINLLISHCERMRYRVAVLDSGEGQTLGQVRALRAKIDSKHAALYYPWVKVLDPVTRQEIYLPPSGFVSGIYARNDVTRAVYKAPANEVVNLALGFEVLLNKAQQEVLNPEGINAFRFFEGRGFRLWGARTVSSDPEWKYVNVRRYFAYLERSIDKGTQWAVFEPNGEALWANVRRTIEDFLFAEWQGGALLGDKPEKAYFVKCDRSTMTQNDLDSGRLVCLIGVAPLKPAEFVIFRIGQWTGDRK